MACDPAAWVGYQFMLSDIHPYCAEGPGKRGITHRSAIFLSGTEAVHISHAGRSARRSRSPSVWEHGGGKKSQLYLNMAAHQ